MSESSSSKILPLLQTLPMWSPAWVLLFGVVQPTEWDQDQFRSKGKLYSLIKGWRGASSCKSQGWGCFMGVLSVEGTGGGLAGGVGLQVAELGAASLRAAWTESHAQCFCTQPCRAEVLALPFPTRNSALKHRVQGLCSWRPVSKWNCTKEKRKGWKWRKDSKGCQIRNCYSNRWCWFWKERPGRWELSSHNWRVHQRAELESRITAKGS